MIVIKSKAQIDLMRKAGQVCAIVFDEIEKIIKPGISTQDIDDVVVRVVKEHKMIASEKGYMGYPKSVCTSVNDEIVHGIPSKNRILHEGDIVSCDLVVECEGYMADACRTYGVGTITEEHQKLIDVAKEAFFKGINYAKEGYRLKDISQAIQEHVEGNGFSVIRDFTGHGIGRKMHEDPAIPNYVCKMDNPRLLRGMTLAIEPMIAEGDYESDILFDNWTAVTCDGGWAAHYENTVLITDGEPEVITLKKE